MSDDEAWLLQNLCLILTATVNYEVGVRGSYVSYARYTVRVLDKDGKQVGSSSERKGSITVANPELWWPYDMNLHNPAYLYTLEVGTTAV